jgi:Uri superfamily endonuclease
LKGIYVITILINKTIETRIGALGKLIFPAGVFAYVGSAQNNLELRTARHISKKKNLFWHVDYLLNNEAAKVTDIYYLAGRKTQECQIANLVESNGAKPIIGFGCSDCHCKSHLFSAQSFQFLGEVMQLLNLV